MTTISDTSAGAALAVADAAGLACLVVLVREGTLPIADRSAVAAERYPQLAPGVDLAAAPDDGGPGLASVAADVVAGRVSSPAALAPFTVGGARVDGATVAALPGGTAATVVLDVGGTLHPAGDAAVFAALCEMTPNFVAVAGLDARIRYLNPAGAQMVGLDSPQDAVGLHLDRCVPESERRLLADVELPTALRGGVWTGERHLLDRTTGAELPVAVTSFLLTDDTGAPRALATIARDIASRRRSEQQLRDAEARLRLIVGQVPAFFWTTDRDLRVVELLGQAASASELTPVGQTLREKWGPEDPIGAVAVHERALNGESVRDVATNSGRTLSSHLEPLRDRTGAVIGVIGVALDVTEDAQVEAQLRHSQKMDAVGQLAGGIAHDHNNMLLGIIGNVDLALLRLPDDADDVRRLLLSAREAAERSAELTRRLLTFGRKDVSQPAATDANEVIRRAAELLHRALGGAVRLELRLDETIRPVWIDPIRLEQVVMNLAINARDAMADGGGDLTIATSMRAVPEPVVEIAVRDTGVGIPLDEQEHVFEPFFTTKPEGTGLGLATVYGIVTGSGGEVLLSSAPGEGTTIRIRFPPHDGKRRPAAG